MRQGSDFRGRRLVRPETRCSMQGVPGRVSAGAAPVSPSLRRSVVSRLSWFAALLAAVTAVPASGQNAFRVIYPAEDQPAADALEAAARPAYEGDLEEVIQEIAEEQGVRIVIDYQAVKAAGVSLDDNINLEASRIDRADAERRGVRFVGDSLDVKSVLRLLIEPYGMKYVIEHGVVRLTTDEAAQRRTVVRAYDVSALLDGETKMADLAAGVSTLASGLNRLPASTTNSPFAESPPVKAVPYKSTLVVSGSPADHVRVERAIAMLGRI